MVPMNSITTLVRVKRDRGLMIHASAFF